MKNMTMDSSSLYHQFMRTMRLLEIDRVDTNEQIIERWNQEKIEEQRIRDYLGSYYY